VPVLNGFEISELTSRRTVTPSALSTFASEMSQPSPKESHAISLCSIGDGSRQSVCVIEL
tara:strand:+ start:918 stop:1097 length:180 start_codon:yes stop_codon:yes gene_type:complete